MFRAAVIILVLSAPLLAQSPDPLAQIGDGDRVELTLKNGTVFRGEVVYYAEGRIKIDITFDSPDTDGSIVLDAAQISRAVRLEKLTKEMKEKLLQDKEDRRRRLLEELDAREKAASEAAGTEPAESETSASDKDLLAKFPPGEWTPEKRQELMKKDAASLSAEEQEFLARYNDWKEAAGRVERDARLERFSPANGWDEKRYADLLGRDPATLSADEREFVQTHDQLVQQRAEKGTEDRSDLLTEFPPGAEWNQQTYERLKSQFVRISVPPTAREQKFLDQYDDWQKAMSEREDKLSKDEELKKELKKELDKEKEGGETPK